MTDRGVNRRQVLGAAAMAGAGLAATAQLPGLVQDQARRGLLLAQDSGPESLAIARVLTSGGVKPFTIGWQDFVGTVRISSRLLEMETLSLLLPAANSFVVSSILDDLGFTQRFRLAGNVSQETPAPGGDPQLAMLAHKASRKNHDWLSLCEEVACLANGIPFRGSPRLAAAREVNATNLDFRILVKRSEFT